MSKTNLFTFASTAILIASSLSAFAAEKQFKLPKDLPPYGPSRSLQAKQIKQIKLDNGLQVWLAPERGFPKVAFVLAVRGGLAADPQDRPGMADFLAATVTEGTKVRSAKQLAFEIQAGGGDLGAEATADAIVVSTSVLAESASNAITLLA